MQKICMHVAGLKMCATVSLVDFFNATTCCMLTWLLKVLRIIFVLHALQKCCTLSKCSGEPCRNERECIWYHFPAYSKARALSLWNEKMYKFPFSAFARYVFLSFILSRSTRHTHTHVSRQRVCFLRLFFIKTLQTLVGQPSQAVFYTDFCVVKHKSISQDSLARCVKSLLCYSQWRIYLRERTQKELATCTRRYTLFCIRVNIARTRLSRIHRGMRASTIHTELSN